MRVLLHRESSNGFLLAAMVVASSVAMAGQPAKVSPDQRPRNPLVRVVTVSQDGLNEQPGQALLDATMRRLDQAAAFEPDIACLPETFTRGEPESLPGPTTRRLAAWAKRHHCYVVCPITVRDGEQVFNSAVLIDRQGELITRYDKIRPTEGELQRSVCPGFNEPSVIETDFGPIGVQICFDVNWHGQWRRLKSMGARIIFFPSAYPAARQLKTLAWLNQVFIVSATKRRAASIYDITGDQIATTGKFQTWAGAVLPVGKRIFETDYHVGKMRAISKKYGGRVRVTWYHDDDLVSLASLDPDLTVDDLIEEYGLTPHPAYIRRAQQAQDDRRPAVGSTLRP